MVIVVHCDDHSVGNDGGRDDDDDDGYWHWLVFAKYLLLAPLMDRQLDKKQACC